MGIKVRASKVLRQMQVSVLADAKGEEMSAILLGFLCGVFVTICVLSCMDQGGRET
jgi:hypothetical protein